MGTIDLATARYCHRQARLWFIRIQEDLARGETVALRDEVEAQTEMTRYAELVRILERERQPRRFPRRRPAPLWHGNVMP